MIRLAGRTDFKVPAWDVLQLSSDLFVKPWLEMLGKYWHFIGDLSELVLEE